MLRHLCTLGHNCRATTSKRHTPAGAGVSGTVGGLSTGHRHEITAHRVHKHAGTRTCGGVVAVHDAGPAHAAVMRHGALPKGGRVRELGDCGHLGTRQLGQQLLVLVRGASLSEARLHRWCVCGFVQERVEGEGFCGGGAAVGGAAVCG